MVIPRHSYWPLLSLFLAVCILYLFEYTIPVWAYNFKTHYSYAKFMSPFIEEVFRFLAIFFSYSCGAFYSILFAGIEMFKYVTHPKFINIPTAEIFFARSICIAVHMLLCAIQISGFQRYERGDKSGMWICFYLAIFFHYSWNSGIGTLVTTNLFGIAQSFSPFFD